ncbi:MAG: hypothetical protein AB7F88_17985 [Pyrinomonadaceae bacterium]
MFCPKCGNPDQSPESYCRGCGTLLPDLDKALKKEISPEEHLKVNSVFSLMTAVVSLALALTLYTTVGFKPDTPWVIYLVAGFLIAISAWQIQTYIRTRMLKKQIERLRPKRRNDTPNAEAVPKAAITSPLLNEPDLSSVVPSSITENTTRNLVQRSAKPK